MADGFELFHVPQQSRRDKLRVLAAHQNNPSCEAPLGILRGFAGLPPLYHPSLLSSDLLTCENPLAVDDKTEASKPYPDPVCVSSVRDGVNFMGYGGDFMNTLPSSSSSSSYYNHQPYSDQQSSLSVTVIPSSIQDTSLQALRVFDQSFNGGEMVTFKPESLSSQTHDTSTLGHGLSLSLSSQQTHQHNFPLELNNVTRSSVPLGPSFTGCSLILERSRFLKPTKQLLEEFCDVGRGIYVERSCQEDTSNLMDPQLGILNAAEVVDDRFISSDHDEHSWRKTRLISILDEVYQRYKHYYQQIQAVVESFESVAGLDNAAPNISFALNAMSKHFRCLKSMITGELHFTSKALSERTFSKHDEAPSLGISHKGFHNQTQVQNLGINQHRVWQPQRGLPQGSVAMLRAWLFEHFLHPYPTDTDKQMLAKETGLSRSQVSNWFVNARVRLWKPMVEEVHMLETLQDQLPSSIEDHINTR
ncbi:Homeobox domain [Macleaya cordata]|uniref:Homeobox domain n=1 Tax=Macleaya cordata TaxID=56857 RepID=A0A200R4Y3_MACCD|nr:Homeobox domain [Macleaya cordata]